MKKRRIENALVCYLFQRLLLIAFRTNVNMTFLMQIKTATKKFLIFYD